jgi:hypothetical protein
MNQSDKHIKKVYENQDTFAFLKEDKYKHLLEIVQYTEENLYEIYQNIKENFYFSKGYPGGINWEYHPGKSNLRIYYPFPTFEEMQSNGVKHYWESAELSWQHIEPRLSEASFCQKYDFIKKDKYASYKNGELKIHPRLQKSITDYFLEELRSKTTDEDGASCDGLSDYMNGEFDNEEIINANLKIKGFAEDLGFEDGCFDELTINLCAWTVTKLINKQEYQDIEVSIQLSEFHNEYCKVLCTEKHDFGFDEYFGYLNGIDYRRDDGQYWGVFVNLNIDHMYDADPVPRNLPRDFIHFPWNRLN